MFGGTLRDNTTNRSAKEKSTRLKNPTKSKLSSKYISDMSGVKESTKLPVIDILGHESKRNKFAW